jgi:drug/metabolite transporter (DMT)-like permease
MMKYISKYILWLLPLIFIALMYVYSTVLGNYTENLRFSYDGILLKIYPLFLLLIFISIVLLCFTCRQNLKGLIISIFYGVFCALVAFYFWFIGVMWITHTYL